MEIINVLSIAAGVLLILSFTFMLMWLGKPLSIKNGEEFSLKYHEIAGNDITKVKGKFWFLFLFYPVTRKNEQILPVWTKNWRRFYWILDAITWSMLADFKKKGDKFNFWFLALVDVVVLALLWVSLGFFIFAIKDSQPGFYAAGISSILLALAAGVFPATIMQKKALPIIDKMDYAQEDIAKIHKMVRWFWIACVINAVYQIINTVIRTMMKSEN